MGNKLHKDKFYQEVENDRASRRVSDYFIGAVQKVVHVRAPEIDKRPIEDKQWLVQGVRKIADSDCVKGLSDPSGIVAHKEAKSLGTGPDADEDGGEGDGLHQEIKGLLVFCVAGLFPQEFVFTHRVLPSYLKTCGIREGFFLSSLSRGSAG